MPAYLSYFGQLKYTPVAGHNQATGKYLSGWNCGLLSADGEEGKTNKAKK
jgi:hypothetical protein